MPRVKQFDEHEVLTKAMELFWKKGFHATSMQDLVDHLGINRASIYDTYGGKRALFNKAFNEYRRLSLSSMRDFLDQYESTRDGIQALFEQAVHDSLNDPEQKGCMVVNSTTELLPTNDGLKDILTANKDHAIQIFVEYLQRGVDRGEISANKDLESIAGLLYTIYGGLRIVTKIDFDQDKLMQIIKTGMVVLD